MAQRTRRRSRRPATRYPAILTEDWARVLGSPCHHFAKLRQQIKDQRNDSRSLAQIIAMEQRARPGPGPGRARSRGWRRAGGRRGDSQRSWCHGHGRDRAPRGRVPGPCAMIARRKSAPEQPCRRRRPPSATRGSLQRSLQRSPRCSPAASPTRPRCSRWRCRGTAGGRELHGRQDDGDRLRALATAARVTFDATAVTLPQAVRPSGYKEYSRGSLLVAANLLLLLERARIAGIL